MARKQTTIERFEGYLDKLKNGNDTALTDLALLDIYKDWDPDQISDVAEELSAELSTYNKHIEGLFDRWEEIRNSEVSTEEKARVLAQLANYMSHAPTSIQDFLKTWAVEVKKRLEEKYPPPVPDNPDDTTDTAPNHPAPPPPPEPPPPRGGDPLVLDLGGDGIITTGLDAGIHFDHDGDGFKELSGFVNSADGLLVLDRNKDGLINDGSELFGDSTWLLDGSLAPNGFAALSEFDDQKDGVIDKNDEIFDELRIFQDFNQNGSVDEGELFSLSEKKVSSLNLNYEDSTFVDRFGNIHRQLGTYVDESGEEKSMTDVVFTMDRTYTQTDMLDVPSDIAALPDAVGYGYYLLATPGYAVR